MLIALAVTGGLALTGLVIGGGASIAHDIGNGRDISWRNAFQNGLKGAAIGGAIGATFVTGGAMTLAASPVVATIGYGTMAFSGGLSYRALADLATTAVSGEVHISSARRYLSSGASAAMLYASFKVSRPGTAIGLVQEAFNNILEGELSSLESYASAAFTSALTLRYLTTPNLTRNLSAVAGGSALGYGLEWLGGIREFDWNELGFEMGRDISAAALANGANNVFSRIPEEVWEVVMRQFINYGRGLSSPEYEVCPSD